MLKLLSVLALAIAGGAIAGSGGTTADTAKVIASATTPDVRVVVRATRGEGDGGIPTAALTVETSARKDGNWVATGSRRLKGTYFWNTVTGPSAVCKLDVETAGEGRSFRPHAAVQLLLSPSLGCGKAQTVRLPLAAGGTGSGTEAVVASAEEPGFRVVVRATKGEEDGGMPTAALMVETSVRKGGSWVVTGSTPLAGTYFWNTVTGPRAVCALDLETAGASASFAPRATVQLLASPSLGCGKAQTFDLTGSGRIGAGTAIASATTPDLRVVLRATKQEDGSGAPTAAVTVSTSARHGGAWVDTGSRRLAGTYFWSTVTGPRAVCRLELRTAGKARAFRPRAVVQLLVSPSLGCGKAQTFRLRAA